jgi:catechol 2,3-dioxygenase-like lactoylglutathione lyase family enzyme
VYLDYAGIRVTDLKKGVRFVTRGLGLEEVRRGRTGHGGVWVLFRDPVSLQRLELNWYPTRSPFATPFVAGEGLDHLGFRVQDVRAAGRRLKSAGARLLWVWPKKGTPEFAYYEGPDGIWVELIRSPAL